MTLFIIKEVTENAVTRYRLIIIMFGSRFIIIIIFLLASKSCMYLFRFPTTVTLRLGTVIKASPVPALDNSIYFNNLRRNLEQTG
jgi:hypothetical protein